MAKRNEKTSSKVASIASKVLRGGNATKKELKSMAASALTQAPNKKK